MSFFKVIAVSIAERVRQLIAFRTLLKYLVLKEIKVKSRGTYLGVAWTLMNPLLTIITYFVIFQYIFRVAIPNFLAFFVLGFLMWMFFSLSMTTAATCILNNVSLVKSSAFPLEVLPLAGVLYHLFHHVIALGVALPLIVAVGGAKLSWHLLWLGGVLAAFVVFTLAIVIPSTATREIIFRLLQVLRNIHLHRRLIHVRNPNPIAMGQGPKLL